jgi:molybdopterin converting factor small subunit
LIALRVHLKLYGVFRSAAGTDAVNVSVPDVTPTVRSAINELVSRRGCEELKSLIFEESADPRSNALILLAGQEIGALAGLDTKLKKDDELSLLPIAHGG